MKPTYTIEIDCDNETLVHFHDGKECRCGITFTTWSNVQVNELGLWFTCPVCQSTSLISASNFAEGIEVIRTYGKDN